MALEQDFILRLACRDAKGIVHAVSGLPYQAGCKNIIDSQQFGDLHGAHATGLFFMRDLDEGPRSAPDAGTAKTGCSSTVTCPWSFAELESCS